MEDNLKKAREINEQIDQEVWGDYDRPKVIKIIADALASAEKKGREDGLGFDAEKEALVEYDKGWNSAIDEARKVADDHLCLRNPVIGDCPCYDIAEAIQKLRR